MMISLHCKFCDFNVTNNETLTFYEQSKKGIHLIVKDEYRNKVCSNFKLVENDEKKSIKYVPRKILCKNCNNKIGIDSLIGPNDEAALCFKAQNIYLLRNKDKFNFEDPKHKWRNNLDKFHEIELRDNQTFNQQVKELIEAKNLQIDLHKFEFNNMPVLNDEAINFNISYLTTDIPRSYQVEIYLACLLSNTIVYLPTGSGKTMIAAMVISYMKKLNPKKKIFFVCDRIPLVFQQGSYIRNETGLKVAEFCSEYKSNFSDDSFSVGVFTCDLLINMLTMKQIYLEDCCCLIIDEIHHARMGHSFSNLIEFHYKKLTNESKPRLIGLTASPSSSELKEEKVILELDRLCNLINGMVYMPFIYRNDLNCFVNRPEIEFNEVNYCSNQIDYFQFLNKFAFYFICKLNPSYKLLNSSKIKLTNKQLKSYIDNILLESNIQKNQKKFAYANLINRLINSTEILDIIGACKSTDFLTSYINNQILNNEKNKIWPDIEITQMRNFVEEIQQFDLSGSPKFNQLVKILLSKSTDINNNDQRCIIFVRKRFTARMLQSNLNEIDQVKDMWRPMVFVGHAGGSYDGMEWIGEQEVVLEKFRQGFSKLLISTNVLQEGLDVPICNKVILFDNFLNMTEYVQSRGRARDMNSKFIQIGTQGDALKYRKIVEAENVLKEIIENRIRKNPNLKFLNQAALHLNKIIQDEKAARNLKLTQTVAYPKTLKLNLQVYLQTDYLIKIHNLSTKTKGFCEINESKNNSSSSFINEAKIFYLTYELKNNHEFKNDYEYSQNVVNNLLKNWNDYFDSTPAINWFKQSSYKYRMNSEIIPFMCYDIKFGNLTSPFEFLDFNQSNQTDDYLNQKIKLIFKFNLRLIVLLFFIENQLHKIEIQFNQIDNLVFYSDEKKDVKLIFNVYIPLNRPYMIFKDDSDEPIKTMNKNINDECVKWSRVLLNSSSKLSWSSIRIIADSNDKQYLIEAFNSIKDKICLFVELNNKHEKYFTIDNLRENFRFNDFESKYSLECFITQCFNIINGKLNNEFVQTLNECENSQLVSKCLERLTQTLETRRWFLNLNKILSDIVKDNKNSVFNFSNNEKIAIETKNEKLAFIRRAVVTPTRIIYYFKEPNFSNRVTRKFGQDSFMRVRFRDEDLSKLNTFSSTQRGDFAVDMNFVHFINYFLTNGLNCCSKKYDFLAMSSSQLRDHACWLYLDQGYSNNASVVRKWMGNFNGIKCVGKYAARLGQSLSSSIETFQTNNFKLIDDIQVGPYCFTDGIGKISIYKAKEICKKFYDSKYISAFQIRFAGIKGVVAIDPNLDANDDPLIFRESMKKFDSGHNRLDVLNIAQYIPCYLNRQIISILSTLGINDETFSQLQDNMLKQLCNILIDKNVASHYLNRYYRCQFSFSKTHEFFDYTNESFFRDILKKIYEKELGDLIRKSRIFIEQGRILMGAIDETGTLNKDQVFVQYTNENNDYDSSIVVTGNVIVAKNPCLHPGDVRIMRAVSNPKLKHMLNCVVFPCVGERPITNMCSGSDLDGDLYFVCWDKNLIPVEMHEPMNYTDSSKIKEIDEKINIKHIIEFFVNFIQVDQLGRLANAHVAIADSSQLGVKDPKCIKLAGLFAKAVDFPKTGEIVKMPSDIKVEEYPDFMEKPSQISYKSNKIIGKMYRKCKLISNLNQNEEESIFLNEKFLIKGYENYLVYANEMYLIYRTELESILLSANLKHENELFAGINLSISSYNNNKEDEKNLLKICTLLVKDLWLKISKQFEFDLKHKFKHEDKLKIISSFYYISHTSKLNKLERRIISFAWIFEDYLLNKITQLNNHESSQFSRNLILFLCDYQNNLRTMSRYIEKIDLCKQISINLNQTNLNFMIIGSFGLFLFEESNESTFMILNENYLPCSNQNMIRKLEDFYDNVSYDPNEVKIKCQQIWNEEETETFNILNFNKNKLKEFLHLRQLVFKNPVLWPILYLIVHFARLDSLFKSIKLDTFVQNCVDYFIDNNIIQDVNKNDVEEEYIKIFEHSKLDFLLYRLEDWNIIRDHIENDLIYDKNIDISRIIFSFYRFKSFEQISPAASSFYDTQLKLKDHFFKVLNKLSINNDIKNYWHLSFNNCDFNNFNENVPKQRKIKLNLRNKFKYPSKNLFVEDASLVLFEKFENDLNLIEFDIYKGNRRSYHLNKECFKPKLICENLTYSTVAFNEYKRHMLKQIYKAKEMMMSSEFKFRFQIKFGDFYLTNLPFKLLEESSQIYLYQLREALNRGYKTYNFSFHDNKQKVSLKIQEDSSSEEEESKEEENKLPKHFNDNQSELYEESDDDDDDLKVIKKKNKTKKKKTKKYKNLAFSSFDSNITSDQDNLHQLFIKNDFESKARQANVVFLEFKNNLNMKSYEFSAYRVKYDVNFNLVRVETMPIKWLSIDVLNNQIENSNFNNNDDNDGYNDINKYNIKKDVRFSFISEKLIDLNDKINNVFEIDMADQIKKCIVRLDDDSTEDTHDSFVVNDYFLNSNVFVRQTKSVKYWGTYENNWKPIFEKARINLPNEIIENETTKIDDLLNKINVSLSETIEHSQNDPKTGRFKNIAKRNEIIVGLKCDINNLKSNEIVQLSNLLWFISKAFEKIL